ncbi:DMT family transporter [Reinekea blandensis]|uniref:Predicted permease, DMT superfamily protein n=1 Tax=Reinekea blandensis MED297 TaxID=314283 RepID=A4BKP5_9GAMM|nr:EamA family transporter [Reinekea blandensis]EAR07297.1 predicted permease, DMT superfamily protein [Reinekea sp. MED297] [Reinekea blandensis MED297]
MDSHQARYSLLAAIAAISMATIGVFSRFSGLPSETLTFFRLFIGALLLLALLSWQRRALMPGRAAWIGSLVSGGFLAGFILFYIQSMNHTTMATAIFMVYLGPILATILAWFFRGQRLSALQWGLMVLALFGFVLMQQGSNFSLSNIGVVYAALAMLCYGGFIFVNGGLPVDAEPVVTAFWQLLAGALVMLPMLFWRESNWAFSVPEWGWLFVVGLWPGFIALYAAIVALKHLPTGVYGTITYLEPVAVSVFGWVMFAELLSVQQLIGGVLIVGAGVGQALAHSRIPAAH